MKYLPNTNQLITGAIVTLVTLYVLNKIPTAKAKLFPSGF